MLRKRSKATLNATSGEQVEAGSGIDFAWKVHSAITDWTAKVDTKAAIVLSLGGVILGFFVTLSGQRRILAGLHGWSLLVERIGVGMTILGVLLAGLVVAPRINRRQARKVWRDNTIYFGHLRYWDPQDLSDKLRSLNTEQQLAILAIQLVNMSKIAWRKHSMLQLGMLCVLLGVGLVAVSATF